LGLIVVAGLADVATWSLLPRAERMADTSVIFAANPDNPWLLYFLKFLITAILVGAGLVEHHFAHSLKSRILLYVERLLAVGGLFGGLVWTWATLSNVVPGLWWPTFL
jgi:hypothetical protein